jgi:hypothetical protein
MAVNLWSFGLVTPPDSRCTLVLRGLLPCEVMPKPISLPIIAALHEAVEQSITSECCAQNMGETSLLNMVMNPVL